MAKELVSILLSYIIRDNTITYVHISIHYSRTARHQIPLQITPGKTLELPQVLKALGHYYSIETLPATQ